MPRLILLTTAALAALTLSACDGKRGNDRGSTDSGHPAPALRAVTQLECPDHEGPLTRIRTAPDGLSCVYAGPKGSEVTLRLVKVEDDSVRAVLANLERELNALLPGVAAKMAKAEADAERASQAAEAEAARLDASANKLDVAAARAEAEAERAQALAEKARALAAGDAAEARAAQARADAVEARLKAAAHARREPGERVSVALPGLRVKADGDRADVRLPGISVKADGDNADVRVGPITIKANDASGNVNINANDTEMSVRSQDDAAEIRTRHKGAGTRATYILADDEPSPQGWRMVGYEARGPEGGPLVIAEVRSKERHKDDEVFDSAKALVRRNAGG